jgi:hypothetical protein
VTFQAAFRRAGAFRRARGLAVLRRRLLARFTAVFWSFAPRAGFALRLLFVIFAICCSLSFSLAVMPAHFESLLLRRKK